MGKLNYRAMIMIAGVFTFLLVVLFAPADQSAFWNSLALGGLMVLFWIFEVLPIYVTALFPFVLAVPLGVLDSTLLAESYGHRLVFLFFGGFVLSLALEKWDVHKQIAETIVHYVGTSKARLLFGFLMATGLLSMWISNTATTLMMLPMALAVIQGSENQKLTIPLLLGIAFAANVGGIGTPIGTPPNLVMTSPIANLKHWSMLLVTKKTLGKLKKKYPRKKPR